MELGRKKNKLYVFFFRKVFRYLLRKNFFSIRIKDRIDIFKFIKNSESENIPIIFVLNHPNWWDAAVVIWLGYDYLKTGGYCIMEEKQIEKHPFFLKIGAIPIIREDYRKSLMTLNFAVSLLEKGYEALYIFPQGELSPNEKYDTLFYPGISYVIKKLHKVNLVYLYLEYKFTSEQRPEIFIDFFRSEEFKDGLNLNKSEFVEKMKNYFKEVNAEFLDAFSNNKLDCFEVVFRGKISLDKKLF